ncbi:MAG TPA: ribosome silencing factor, partial [Flavobacteriaceae bacterium]|nr:ribosome silencing factor [Flavobacteriaceae bacterium]
MSKKEQETDQLITHILKGIEDVKGQDIEILDLRDIENTVCDYFIICNGNSNTQVNAIVNSIQKTVSKSLKEKPWHIEGSNNAEWILMDFVH